MVPAYEGKKPYIFVSYAHADNASVLPLIEKLFIAKYRVWYDEGIAPGSEWPKNIEDHLNDAKAVLVFNSEASAKSPNCANEVSKASKSDKLIISYCLGGTKQEILKDRKEVNSYDELIRQIPDEYIGDGTGYERKIGRKRYGLAWNILLGFAIAFAGALGFGLYELNQGYFDKYLPNVDIEASAVTTKAVAKTEEQSGIAFENQLIAGAVAEYAGKGQLSKRLTFSNDEERDRFIEDIGWNGPPEDFTYNAMTTMNHEVLHLRNASDKIIDYVSYMPKIKHLYIDGGVITTVKPLMDCPQLETVSATFGVFPFEIPENAGFTVIMQK